jgi:hypothetical protein
MGGSRRRLSWTRSERVLSGAETLAATSSECLEALVGSRLLWWQSDSASRDAPRVLRAQGGGPSGGSEGSDDAEDPCALQGVGEDLETADLLFPAIPDRPGRGHHVDSRARRSRGRRDQHRVALTAQDAWRSRPPPHSAQGCYWHDGVRWRRRHDVQLLMRPGGPSTVMAGTRRFGAAWRYRGLREWEAPTGRCRVFDGARAGSPSGLA